MIRVAVYKEWFIVDFLCGWYDSESRQMFMYKKSIEVFPVITVILSSLS